MPETQTQPQQERSQGQAAVVLGTIGYDAHVVGIWVLRHALRDAGFNVVYLGALASPEEFINAAKETSADAIWVSSLYGMARIDCAGLREKCIEAGMENLLMYIGGILVTDPEEWDETEKLFREMGFDRVYPPGTKPETAIADLKNDLGLE